MPSSHIRPRVRSKKTPSSKPRGRGVLNNDEKTESLEEMLARTNKRMDGILRPPRGAATAPKSTSPASLKSLVQHIEKFSVSEVGSTERKPASILREPKYRALHADSACEGGHKDSREGHANECDGEKAETRFPIQKESLMVKDSVVERPNPQPQPLASRATPYSAVVDVEGFVPKTAPNGVYTPCSDTKKKDEEDENRPLVVGSISELIEAANPTQGYRTKPSTPEELKNAEVIEADLAFSVMSPDDFEAITKNGEEEAKEEEKELAATNSMSAFRGHFDIFREDSGNESPRDGDSHQGLGDGDIVLFDDDMEEASPAPETRAFMKIWTALAAWITPEAIRFAATGNPPCSNPPKSDLEASRCAGLMALANMHLKKCVDEVGGISAKYSFREIRERLAVFLQTFSYSRPVVQFDTRLMRATTCVLLAICWPMEVKVISSIPKSVEDVGIVQEEYRYLARSALKSLAQV